MKTLFIAMVIVFSLIADDAIADLHRKIVHDPFSYTNKQENNKPKTRKSDSRNKLAPTFTWQPTLLATIVAGSSSMANVAGKVVKVGEKVDGYELIAVDRESATFKKNGRRQILRLSLRSKRK